MNKRGGGILFVREPQIRGEVEFASRLLLVRPCGSTSVRVHSHGSDVGSGHHSVGTGGAVRCSPAGCELEVGQRLSAAAAAAACRSSSLRQRTADAEERFRCRPSE